MPAPFSTIPMHRLSYLQPSPIHALPGLTQLINSKQPADTIQLWTKREDQAGPLACYGNKYRKFEYIIPDIQDHQSITTIVSEGAVQSNHTVQVAAMANKLGLKCHVLLHRGIGGLRRAIDQSAYSRVGNVQLLKLLGAQVIMTDETDTGNETGPLLPLLDDLRSQGEIPYWISSGASLHPLGGLGYARCAFEIAQQEVDIIFDEMYVACGSGSTLAGLIAGFKLLEKTSSQGPRRIVGVLTSPTRDRAYHEERILSLARQTAELIGMTPDVDIQPSDILLDDRFTGEGYGVLDQASRETIQLAAQLDTLLLDPVYTAKAMQSILARSRPGSENEESSPLPRHVLFIHTGGVNALSAYADVMELGS